MQKKHKDIEKPKNQEIRLVSQHIEFEGPLPPPEILSGYAEIDKNIAVKIVEMAEASLKTKQEVVVKEQVHRHKTKTINSFMAFVITIASLAGGIYLTSIGKDGASILPYAIASVGFFLGVSGVAKEISGIKSDKKEGIS